MEGIAAVTARIGEIQGLVSSMAPPRVGPPMSAPRNDFAATLEQARTAGAAASGSTALGSTAFGGAALGSAALGSTALGGAALGGAALSSPALSSPASGAGTASTARTASGVPVALAAYGNGKIPASALTSIGHGDHRLWAPAAQAYTAMEQAAAKDGVRLKVTDSYRSYEGQVDVARRKGLYSEGGLAAKPGTSEHGWGLSVDLSLDGRAQAWMRTNGARFGFEENVPREPWHWTFTSGS